MSPTWQSRAGRWSFSTRHTYQQLNFVCWKLRRGSQNNATQEPLSESFVVGPENSPSLLHLYCKRVILTFYPIHLKEMWATQKNFFGSLFKIKQAVVRELVMPSKEVRTCPWTRKLNDQIPFAKSI